MEIKTFNLFSTNQISEKELKELATDIEKLFELDREQITNINFTILSNAILIKVFSISKEMELMAISDLSTFRFNINSVLIESNLRYIQRSCKHSLK